MVEKGIRGGYHVIYQYLKAINKYMKNYDKNNESLYLNYGDVNNLYGWVMPQKLPLRNLKWVHEISQFNEDFIKSHNDDSNEGYFLEVDVQCPENLHNLYNDSSFLHERMKIEKVEKLVANLHDKEEYVMHIRNLKQALNHGLVLKKFHRAINQRVLLKPYIDMNTELRKKAKNDFEKDFLS